ncbi:LysR family transcriptional regulator [Anopheles sinensis]|uniref:LysR family transcriptional regulator n=1 Tax=Anopheles sinensis TaxID=74873 RepID=A0A084WU62_ANOSI|nr:LysR family transcriptional regulator [Anopheles sinensis]
MGQQRRFVHHTDIFKVTAASFRLSGGKLAFPFASGVRLRNRPIFRDAPVSFSQQHTHDAVPGLGKGGRPGFKVPIRSVPVLCAVLPTEEPDFSPPNPEGVRAGTDLARDFGNDWGTARTGWKFRQNGRKASATSGGRATKQLFGQSTKPEFRTVLLETDRLVWPGPEMRRCR